MSRRPRHKRDRELSGDPAVSVGNTDGFVRWSGWFATAMLSVACFVPLAIWGNPYPAEVLIYWAAGLLSAVALLFAPVPELPLAARWFDEAAARAAKHNWSLVFALVALGLSALVALLVFSGAASTPDEIAQYWHAKVLLGGNLSLPVDTAPEFFSLETVVDVGGWYSQFPIGGPVSLVPGALIGKPWLVNPVLAALATLVLHDFVRTAFSEVDARRSAAIFCVTPMMVFMAGTWMNHVPTMFLAVCALSALARWERAVDRRTRFGWAAAIGAAAGAIATVRPLDAIAVALPLGLFQLHVLVKSPRRWPDLLPQIGAGTLAVAPLFVANRLTTGAAFRFGYDVLWGAGHRVGFHSDPYGKQHTLRGALEFAMSYVGQLNMYLFAWPLPAILLIVLTCALVRGKGKWDVLVLGLFLSQLVAYSLYWGEGTFLGPRFLYTAVPAMVVLVARLPSLVALQFGVHRAKRVGAILFLSMAVAWLAPAIPFSARALASQATSVRRNLKADYGAAVRATGIHNALVFLREPFSSRLARRLWGVGLSRSDAARLIASRDACALHDSLIVAERLPRGDSTGAAAVRSAAPFEPGDGNVRVSDGRALITSARSISPSCRTEIDTDRELAGAPFGPALLLESDDSEGRVNGDIIYVADLGERNDLLKVRFPDRQWYRLVLQQGSNGALIPRIARY